MSPTPSNEPERAAAGRLPGRSRFLDDIDALIGECSPGRQVAVLVIDVATPDQYEELRRTLGEAAAEKFCDASGASISAYLPAQCHLYGLSAARFGCILRFEAPRRAEEVLDGLAYRIRLPEPTGRHIPLATSLGIGVAWHPGHGATAAELLRAAISGARQSLQGGRGWCPYSPSFDQASQRAIHLLRDVGSALAAADQLRLVYQPKIDLKTGRGADAEALLRWNHPTLGPVPPGEFVPLVERTTLVHALTEWALAAALSQVALWRAAGLAPRISVNVSMQDLADDGFAARLAKFLQRHGVQPDWIDIEVTESALMTDLVRVGHQFAEIRQLGVGIEIDDYGTGQSGLSYLKHIPATHVKIDQAFVSRLAHSRDDQIMVRSTIALAHELGRRVVAEGIEDQRTLGWLRAQGCDAGQGDAISPPLKAGRFEEWLRTR